MNSIRQIQALNKRELDAGVAPSASWHRDYAHTAYIYIGGLPFDLSEGDIVAIFSQFGEPVHLNLVRDKDTGKSKGFAFLKYEDQRSTDLAVDNMGGTTVLGRMLRVDHTEYKFKDGEEIGDNTLTIDEAAEDEHARKRRKSGSDDERPMLKEEKELADLMREHDEEDPMKQFMIEEKRDEVRKAVKKYESGRKREKKERRKDKDRKPDRRRDEDEDRHRTRGIDQGGSSRDDQRHKRTDSADGPRRRQRSRDTNGKDRHKRRDPSSSRERHYRRTS